MVCNFFSRSLQNFLGTRKSKVLVIYGDKMPVICYSIECYFRNIILLLSELQVATMFITSVSGVSPEIRISVYSILFITNLLNLGYSCCHKLSCKVLQEFNFAYMSKSYFIYKIMFLNLDACFF